MDEHEAAVRKVAIVMLGAVLIAAIGAVMLVALFSDHPLSVDNKVVVIGMGALALLGGAVLVRPWRWRDERREDE